MQKFYTVVLLAVVLWAAPATAQENQSLRQVQTIPLPNVEGRIDHFAVDVKGQRLFVAALGNNTVEVLDLASGKRAHTIRGLKRPQGIQYVPELNQIFVANAEDGACQVFDGKSYAPVKTIDFTRDADNIRYDPSTARLYVGYGDGALGVLDAAQKKRLGDIKLKAHPESFQLEKSGPRIFVNVPEAGHIAVIDRDKRAVIAQWPNGKAQANFPMALDETHRRLFVGFRKPAKLIIYDTESGKAVADLDGVGDSDDLFYDAAHRRIYASGGEGFLGVYAQRDADHYQAIAKIPTAAGARTSLFVPEFNRFYLAVPHRGKQGAEIRVYEAQPE